MPLVGGVPGTLGLLLSGWTALPQAGQRQAAGVLTVRNQTLWTQRAETSSSFQPMAESHSFPAT